MDNVWLTVNLGVGAILAVADVDKVKGGITLGKANGKVTQFCAAVETSGETSKVGDNLGNNGSILVLVSPLSRYRGAEGLRGFPAAFEALSYPGVLKLRLLLT